MSPAKPARRNASVRTGHAAAGLSALHLAALACLALTGCAQGAPEQPRLTQPQELCRSWGYDPNDPVCLRTFRRDLP